LARNYNWNYSDFEWDGARTDPTCCGLTRRSYFFLKHGRG
jgi:hypothetical protein